MILKLGSKGPQVETLQEALELYPDGDFGPKTDAAVRAYQKENRLSIDGVVGPNTWDHMGLATTDNTEMLYETESGLLINRYYLPKGEYKSGPTNKEYVFLHHTAGWNNPYKMVDSWGRDTRGAVATEFILGGPSIKGNDNKYDGDVIQCIPEGGYGWHLGKNGSRYMHTNSVGIEICNFGYLYERAGTYFAYPAKYRGEWRSSYKKYQVAPNQVTDLGKKFRGHRYWHRYSDAQIESVRQWLLYIADRDNIDIRKGLIEQIKNVGAFEAFGFNDAAYYGKVKGLWTHTNVRPDKTDCFPQTELVDMLLSL